VFPTHKQHLQKKIKKLTKEKTQKKNKQNKIKSPKARKQLYNKKWNLRTHKKEQKQAKITKKNSSIFLCC
jgi:hypothetical protein